MSGSKARSKTVSGRSTSPKATAKSARKAAAKSQPSANTERAAGKDASRLIDEQIRNLGDWRGRTLAAIRSLILEVNPQIIEEWKWMGTPVWSCAGKNICTGETYKQVVKLTFARGASLKDPHKLFNSSLEGNTRRAIDIREGEAIDAKAFKTLIRSAIAENQTSTSSKSKSATRTKPPAKDAGSAKLRKVDKSGVVLLSGGNPQIAKADGDAPVQAYIKAMPGWKSDLGKRLDALIVRSVPNVRKAVKWNSPFYGIDSQGWFLSFHVLTRYVKVTFFKGIELRPVPPGGTERSKEARWIDIYEDDVLDETQLANWVQQAAALPGWIP